MTGGVQHALVSPAPLFCAGVGSLLAVIWVGVDNLLFLVGRVCFVGDEALSAVLGSMDNVLFIGVGGEDIAAAFMAGDASFFRGSGLRSTPNTRGLVVHGGPLSI